MDTFKIWEERLQKTALVIGRITLAYLYFSQLFWKLPPTFGCPADFSFTTTNSGGALKRTSGLCDWVGIEVEWAKRSRPLLVADTTPAGGPNLYVDIRFLSEPNGLFLENFVKPNIRWFGYVVWGMEAFIVVSLFFGVFSRLGGLVAIAQSAQLLVGLAGISNPFEWEWAYNLMVVLSLLAFAYAPGRVLGVDQFLIRRLKPLAEKGNRAALGLLWLM